jgi:hypothetical protein
MNIDFQVNHNINQNYYLELIRSIRKLMGFPIQRKEYYKFRDVKKFYNSRLRASRKKTKKKKKRNTKRK